MLPLQQADEVKEAIVEYLKATFTFSDKRVDQAFEDYLLDSNEGMFKGPYVNLKLPFESLTEEEYDRLKEIIDIHPPFRPYEHQAIAFKRLSSKGKFPEPVLLTTGTGSGKTESFLYPILDYCFHNRDKPGIKAIILYPMNALATDQAKRLADIIYNHQDQDGKFILRDKITAGLFIGEGKQKGLDRETKMGPEWIIEHRDTILESPPDILFTNFKMLDFSLMQARFHGLWRHNFKNADLLRYLVLDELHTYDGAKGSDVGNLIRRLKLKLSIKENKLVPVGTSATIAGGLRGKTDLIKFFETVFGIKTNQEAIIEEHRLQTEDFFVEVEPDKISVDEIENCVFNPEEDYATYLQRQIGYWNIPDSDPLSVGKALIKSQFLRDLIASLNNRIRSVDHLVNDWGNKNPIVGNLDLSHKKALLGSLLSLVSFAKSGSSAKQFPFLYVQVIHWLRSLHQSVRVLQTTPLFKWESDHLEERKALPPYFCRECGSSGWVGIKKESNEYLEDDLSRIRQSFIANNHNKNVYFISNMEDSTWEEVFAPDYRAEGTHIEGYLDPFTLVISDKKRSEHSFRIIGVRRQNGDRIEKVCPHCNSQDNLALIGTGLPTLESVAASQLLTTDLTDIPAAERKLLAFSNQVQDAAHQAGFIENRNYRFSFRQAIQTIVNQKSDVSLEELYNSFEAYWKKNISHGDQDKEEAFYYRFIPPDAESRLDITKDYRLKSGAFSKKFTEEFSNRLSWEIWSEFSYAAQVGRTLEKSASSASYMDIHILHEVFHQMKTWFQNNALVDRIDEASFVRFCIGLLHRLRIRGGVDHQYLKKFRTERSNYYLITQNTNKKYFLMKNFGRNTRLPRFLVLDPGPNRAVFDIVKADSNRNWFMEYFLKSFDQVGNQEKQLINDFYEQLIEYLDANDVLSKKVAAGITNYGLNPKQIFLTNEVVEFECTKCGHSLTFGSTNKPEIENMACLQYRCSGKYHSHEKKSNYYNRVYNRSFSNRLYARDHTGLIDRDVREQLEEQFKKRKSIRDCNVLIATSTLEMGIDIGDLNATFNATLPPETSNYLQRIGRAGRKSGSSFILNLTGRNEHDLYYFTDPLELMEGSINTPACFLEAKDILNRHFMAFCFDSWTTLDPTSNRIPQLLRALRIQSLPVGSDKFIINKLIVYIENNLESLKDAFLEQYLGYIGDYSIKLFEETVRSASFLTPLQSVHQNLKSELDYYSARQKAIKARIKSLPENDPETSLLKRELKSISGIIYRIYDRNTIEHLTNLGILPNYAFPETGVRLSAEVYRKVFDEDGKFEYKTKEIPEIVRPASSALKELAPSNFFYTQGYQLPIKGVNLADQIDFEEYRFCSNCDHFQPNVATGNDQGCPNCGDQSFASVNNIKNLYRLNSVISVDDSESIKIKDSSDDRDRKFYHISLHVSTSKESSQGAYILKRVPFGIEYFTSARYTEINAGVREDSPINARSVTINEKELPAYGFIICKHCGYANERPITPHELQNRRRSYHFNYCNHRDEIYRNESDEIFEETYIYRQYLTEALKILLPVQDFRSDEKIALFKAGLFLGLKEYYNGRPDHIDIRNYEEYNPETRRKNKYLILLETIPGGTGYLSKLFDTDRFKELITKAYEKIAFCSCKDQGKDGCYKCIYTYSNQYERANLSRKEAEDLFSELMEKSDEWNHISSLSGGTDQSNIEESDLEFRFIELLRELGHNSETLNFEEEITSGIRHYKLEIKNEEGSVKYEIIPQNRGAFLPHVSLKTIPDFLIRCISSVDIKPVAVYLDGYEFHASSAHPRMKADIDIREAIRASNRYQLWVLTWDDLNMFQSKEFDSFAKNHSKEVGNMMKSHPMIKDKNISVDHQNSVTRLMRFLENPFDSELWSKATLFCQQEKLLVHCFEKSYAEDLPIKTEPELSLSKPNNTKGVAFLKKIPWAENLGFNLFIDPMTLKVHGMGWYGYEKSWQKEQWQSFWEVYNILQFTSIHLVDYSYQPVQGIENDLLLNFSEELHPIVQYCLKNHIEINEDFDFDLLENGRIKASAELGSESEMFVINPFDDQSKSIFLEQGYEVFGPEEFIKKFKL